MSKKEKKMDFDLPADEPHSLWKLRKVIGGMNATEKNIFKKHVRNYSNANNQEADYIRLFECVNDCLNEIARLVLKESAGHSENLQSQEDLLFYQIFRTRFARRKIFAAKELGSRANYIFDKILESQRIQHTDESLKRDLLCQYLDIQYLYRKEMYSECLRMLRSALKNAAKIDEFNLMLEFLRMERQILARTRGELTQSRLRSIYKEEKRILQVLSTNRAFYDLYQELFLAYASKIDIDEDDEIKEKINALIKYLPADEAPFVKDSYEIQLFFHLALVNMILIARTKPSKNLEFLKGKDLADVHVHLKKIVEIQMADPIRKKEDPSRFRDHLFNYLTFSFTMGNNIDLSMYEDELDKVDKDDLEFLRSVVYVRILYFIRKGDVRLAKKFLEDNKVFDQINSNYHSIPVGRRYTMCFWGGMIYFISQDLKTADQWFNLNTQDADSHFGVNSILSSLVCRLLIKFELGISGNITYKSVLIKPLEKYLDKSGNKGGFESVLLAGLKKILKIENSQSPKLGPLCDQLLNDLKKERFDQKIQGNIEVVLGWLESKATGKPLRATIVQYL